MNKLFLSWLVLYSIDAFDLLQYLYEVLSIELRNEFPNKQHRWGRNAFSSLFDCFMLFFLKNVWMSKNLIFKKSFGVAVKLKFEKSKKHWIKVLKIILNLVKIVFHIINFASIFPWKKYRYSHHYVYFLKIYLSTQ